MESLWNDIQRRSRLHPRIEPCHRLEERLLLGEFGALDLGIPLHGEPMADLPVEVDLICARRVALRSAEKLDVVVKKQERIVLGTITSKRGARAALSIHMAAPKAHH